MEMKTHKCFNIAHQREAEMRALYDRYFALYRKLYAQLRESFDEVQALLE